MYIVTRHLIDYLGVAAHVTARLPVARPATTKTMRSWPLVEHSTIGCSCCPDLRYFTAQTTNVGAWPLAGGRSPPIGRPLRVLEIPTPRWTTIQAKELGVAPPDVVAATLQERAWTSPIWYTPSAEARKSAKAGVTVADLKKKGAVALNDAQLKALLVEKSPWVQNTVTGDKYQIVYAASGKSASGKPATPLEPGFITQGFAANQAQFQLRYVGSNVTRPSLFGNVADASYLGTTSPYFINNGKLVTTLVGTPIEIAVYKVGDKYVGARSNEFGYANYEIIPTVAVLNPFR